MDFHIVINAPHGAGEATLADVFSKRNGGCKSERSKIGGLGFINMSTILPH